jgi:hypothetical protein
MAIQNPDLIPMAPRVVVPDRQKTHGKFHEYAYIAQALKDIIKDSPNYIRLMSSQKEGLDMICGKIARICTGNPDEPDHWVDIGGYAQRVVESFSFEGKTK